MLWKPPAELFAAAAAVSSERASSFWQVEICSSQVKRADCLSADSIFTFLRFVRAFLMRHDVKKIVSRNVGDE